MFLLDPGEVNINEVINLREKGLHLPIEVELTEEMAAYYIVAVPWPFQPQIPDPDLYLFDNRPVGSNTLLLRHNPE